MEAGRVIGSLTAICRGPGEGKNEHWFFRCTCGGEVLYRLSIVMRIWSAYDHASCAQCLDFGGGWPAVVKRRAELRAAMRVPAPTGPVESAPSEKPSASDYRRVITDRVIDLIEESGLISGNGIVDSLFVRRKTLLGKDGILNELEESGVIKRVGGYRGGWAMSAPSAQK